MIDIGVILASARVSVAATVVVFTAIAMDPMVVHVMFVGACMALFPTFRNVVGATALFGVYRIAVSHDPILGTLGSFLTCTGEGMDIVVTGSLGIVTALAALPAAVSILSFKWSKFRDEMAVVLPLLVLLLSKLLIESEITFDVADAVSHLKQYADEAVKTVRALFGGA